MKNYWLILQNGSSNNISETLKSLDPVVLSANDLFNEKVEVNELKHVDFALNWFNRPFYFQRSWQRLLTALRMYVLLYDRVKKLKRPDVIIYTNDGVFQRIILSFFPGVRKIMILQGVLSGNEFYIPRRNNNYYFQLLLPKLFRPSKLGQSSPDKVLVVSDYCRSYLVRNGVDFNSIEIVGMKYDMSKFDFMPFDGKKRVLFIVQAFMWHGLSEMSSIMLDEISNWNRFCEKLSISFNIRPHPRNDTKELAEFTQLHALPQVSECIIVGMNSTMLLELKNFGYNVFISDVTGSNWSKSNAFGSMKDFLVLKSLPANAESLFNRNRNKSSVTIGDYDKLVLDLIE